jgi:hypothetical protein
MLTTMRSTTFARLSVVVLLSVIASAPNLWANIVAYQANSFAPAATLGSTSFGSCPTNNPVCVVVTINFIASTSTIVPFSVVGASGFENFMGQGSVSLFNDQTGQSMTANFLTGQIYVSVDQTNGGIGFGSLSVGPTYPLGVYGGTPSIPYSSYDLTSNFTLSNGFAWFCPVGCTLGQQGPALATDQGALTITPTGPVLGSSFFANVIQVTTPEPATCSAAMGLILLAARRCRNGTRRVG